MKITGPGSIRASSTRRAGKGARQDGASFADHLAVGVEPAAPATGSVPLAPVDGLLGLQEVPDPLAERRKAVARGEDLLDRLDEIRHGLLLGTISERRLEELAVLLRRRAHSVRDPDLAATLAEIELRVAVEIAKLSQLKQSVNTRR